MINYSTIIENNRGHLVQYRKSCQVAPWCFPPTFRKKGTLLQAGVCPIITVDSTEENGYILMLSTRQQPTSIERYFPLQTIAEDFALTINIAESWLRTNLPLWIADRSVLNPSVYCIFSSDVQFSPVKVDGASAGLSLILVALSEFLQVPLPINLFCSATISIKGLLGPVDGLERKLQCIAEHSTLESITFICCQEQEQQAKDICESNNYNIQIQAFSTIETCLNRFQIDEERTLSEELTKQLISQDITTFIHNAFYQALEGQNHIYGWNGLKGTAQLLKRQVSLPEDSLRQLQIIELIATRYSKSSLDILFSIEDIKWLQTTPLPTRLPVLAHLLQQYNEVPESLSPAARDQLLLEAHKHLPNLEESNEEILIAPPYLKLWGAYGRLQEALRNRGESQIDITLLFHLQHQSFQGWLNNAFYEQASYPLSEMLRLASIINTEKFHQLASSAYRQLSLTPSGITPNNHPFILFAELQRLYNSAGNWQPILEQLLESKHINTPHFLYPSLYNWILEKDLQTVIPDRYNQALKWKDNNLTS